MIQKTPNLLISCCGHYRGHGRGHGGLCFWRDGEVQVIDEHDTTGLCLDDNGHLWRFCRKNRELLRYDPAGRLVDAIDMPEIVNGHDVRVRDGVVAMASTGTNEIRFYRDTGQFIHSWQADGDGDAWHINGLWFSGGQLYFTAFGRFRTDRAWKGRDQMSGFLFKMSTQLPVLDGLSEPHSPRLIDGRWWLCESMSACLVVQQDNGRLKRYPMGEYTRGLAVDRDRAYVGRSASRDGEDAPASMEVLGRFDLDTLAQHEVPFPEIYEILPVTDEMVAGLLS